MKEQIEMIWTCCKNNEDIIKKIGEIKVEEKQGRVGQKRNEWGYQRR